jgi:hypothetical protein
VGEWVGGRVLLRQAGGPAGGQVGARVWGRSARDGEEAELMPPFFGGHAALFVLRVRDFSSALLSRDGNTSFQVCRERAAGQVGLGGGSCVVFVVLEG